MRLLNFTLAAAALVLFVCLCFGGTPTPSWERITVSGNVPVRYLSTGLFDGQRMYLYGGTDASASQPRPLTVINFGQIPPVVSTFEGPESQSGGDVGRSFAAFAPLYNNRRLFVQSGNEFLSKTATYVAFDRSLINTFQGESGWLDASRQNYPINANQEGSLYHGGTPAEGVAAASDGFDQVYFFGGRSDGGVLSAVSKLDLARDQWSVVVAGGGVDAQSNIAPTPRLGALMTYVPSLNGFGPYLVIYGGYFQTVTNGDVTTFDEVYILALSPSAGASSWVNLTSVSGTLGNILTGRPPARASGNFVANPDRTKAFLYGGVSFTFTSPSTVTETYLSDLWELDYVTMTWNEITGFPVNSSAGALGYHVLLPAFNNGEESLFLYGGIPSSGVPTNAIWKITFTSCAETNCFIIPDGDFNPSGEIVSSFGSSGGGSSSLSGGAIAGIVLALVFCCIFCCCIIICVAVIGIFIVIGATLLFMVQIIYFGDIGKKKEKDEAGIE